MCSVVLIVDHTHGVTTRRVMRQRSLESNQGKEKHEPKTVIYIVCVPSLAVKFHRHVG